MSEWIIWRVTDDGRLLERMTPGTASGGDERQAVAAWCKQMDREEDESIYVVCAENAMVSVQAKKVISFTTLYLVDGQPTYSHPHPKPKPEVEVLDGPDEEVPMKRQKKPASVE